MKTLLFIAGTRPELIKLAPLIRQVRHQNGPLGLRTCFSGQHVEILESVLGDFDVRPDLDLRGSMAAESLSKGLAHLLAALDDAIVKFAPDGVVVQGDTHTALAGALAAFHRRVPVFHVEAGLRTADPALPFPEEMNRRLVSRLAALHFAPTTRARDNLLEEGVAPGCVHVTGNTGIDALELYLDRPSEETGRILERLRSRSRPVLVTLHRRENLDNVHSVARAVKRLVLEHNDVEVLWILHRNGTRAAVLAEFPQHSSVHLLEPLGYHSFVHLMANSYLILTDSGGIQEEAPVLGKPVLVLRADTERPEAVEAGCSRVVGCETAAIVSACGPLLRNPLAYRHMSRRASPFGDGRASQRILGHIKTYLGLALPKQAGGRR